MTREMPRRLTPPAAPGALLKRFEAAPIARTRREESDDDAAYLAMVRECPCLNCGHDPCGEAAHVRFASAAFHKASGLSKKPADRWALPLCGEDHRIRAGAQHKGNERAYWEALGINPLIVAERLYAKRGDLVAMRAVVMVAIAERGAKP